MPLPPHLIPEEDELLEGLSSPPPKKGNSGQRFYSLL